MSENTLILGLDECGTGELAGPMAVCAFHSNAKANRLLYTLEVKDSKATSVAYRKDIREVALRLSKEGDVLYNVAMASPFEIDTEGVLACWERLSRLAVTRVLERLAPSWTTTVELHVDGESRVPGLDDQVEQVLGARLDVTDLRVSAASILAKEALDWYWQQLHGEFPEWDFPQHRGAGSPHHIRMLQQYGPIPGVHRKRPVATLLDTVAKGGGPIGLNTQR